MKHSALPQFATIHEESASLFDARLNEKVLELQAFDPKVIFSEHIPFYAHITYVVKETTPETLAEGHRSLTGSLSYAVNVRSLSRPSEMTARSTSVASMEIANMPNLAEHSKTLRLATNFTKSSKTGT